MKADAAKMHARSLGFCVPWDSVQVGYKVGNLGDGSSDCRGPSARQSQTMQRTCSTKCNSDNDMAQSITFY